MLQWSKLIEKQIWGSKMRKKQPPTTFVCTSLADSYSSSQATAAREIEARSCWGVRVCRVYQTAIVSSQNRLTRCFREFASQQHKKTIKITKKKKKCFISRAEGNLLCSRNDGYITDKNTDFTKNVCCFPGRYIWTILGAYPRNCGREKLRSHER